MMAKFLSRARLIAYMPGLAALRATVVCQRSFSNSVQQCSRGEGNQSEVTAWPDTKLGPLSVQDKRFPLPGNVGSEAQLYIQQQPEDSASSASCDVLHKPLPHDRHAAVFAQFINAVSESEESAEDFMKEAYKNPKNILEMIAQDCPKSLKKEFNDLFPDVDLSKGSSLTILTLCQKTKNDMSSWSDEVNVEREELLENFMMSAIEICTSLTEAGFWADFIDPSSGQAFLGTSNPNYTLFETDERFKQLGFNIEDLGCCKCIRHQDWGMHIFVGTLFTTAPPECEEMKEIMFNGMASQTQVL